MKIYQWQINIEFYKKAPYGLSDKLVDLYLYVANKTGKISIDIY